MELDLAPIFMSEDLYNLKLPSPEVVSYYNDLNNRVLWLDQEVDNQLLEYSKYIIDWNRKDFGKPVEERKPIKIMIFSPGGDLAVCNHFIDVIEMSKTPVWAINMGMSMSAAFYIQISCHKKFCTKNSVALIHQGGARLAGNATDLVNSARNYETQLKGLKDRILSKTLITSKLYNSKSKEDWYLNAEEQLKYGIADEIINDIECLF